MMRLVSFSIIIAAASWGVPVAGIRLNRRTLQTKKEVLAQKSAAEKVTTGSAEGMIITLVHVPGGDNVLRHFDCSLNPIYLRGRKDYPLTEWDPCGQDILTNLGVRTVAKPWTRSPDSTKTRTARKSRKARKLQMSSR